MFAEVREEIQGISMNNEVTKNCDCDCFCCFCFCYSIFQNRHYPYRAFLSNQLSYDNEAKFSQLAGVNWANDDKEAMNLDTNQGICL